MLLAEMKKFPPVKVKLKNGAFVCIRFLLPSDGKALAEFYRHVPAEDFRFYCPYPLTEQQALENAAEAFSPAKVVLVLEKEHNQIGGYCWYRWQEGCQCSTFGICISRSLQGTGAGKALMTRLLEIAREVGPPIMSLTVQVANVRAVNLYQKMGFVIVRKQMREEKKELNLPPEPEYYMEKKVR